MSKNTIPTTSPFATKNTNAEHVAALIAAALEQASPEGTFPSTLWGQAEFGGIKESRGWLIARRAWLEVNRPDALIEVPAGTDFSPEPADGGASLRKFGKLLEQYRHDGNGDSWGELMVRTGLSEGKVRKAWEAVGAKQSRGHRIGHGGRYLGDNPELYLEHRRSEGAHVPAGTTKRSKEIEVTDLLNAKDPKTGKLVRFQKPAARGSKAS